MKEISRPSSELRVLVLAETVADAEWARSVVLRAGAPCVVCHSLNDLCNAFAEGAGAILATEGPMAGQGASQLADSLRAQPVWSDVSVLLLTDRGADSESARRLASALPNVTLLERSTPPATLASVLRLSLNARMNQYALRDHTSERKRAENALRESEATFRAMFGVSSVGLAQADSTTARFLRVNAAMCRITGYSEAELLERTIYDITHPDEHDRDREERERVNRGEKEGYELDKRYLRKDGSQAWVHVTVNVIRGEDGRALRNTAVIQDIAERKRADEALAQTAQSLARERERLAIALRTGQMGVYEWRVGEATVWWSPELYAVYGADPASFTPTVETFSALIHPEDREELWKKTQDTIARREVFEHEYRIIRPDGSVRWVANRSQVGLDAAGQVERITGVAVDATERKRSERALLESEARYRSLFEGSALPVWEEDFSQVAARFAELWAAGVRDFRKHLTEHPEEVRALAGMVKIVDVNQASLAFFGVRSKEELLVNLPSYFGESSWDFFREELIALAEGRSVYRAEIPIVDLRRESRVVSFHLAVAPGSENLSRVLVTFLDITDRKRAEEALRESEAQLRLVAETLPVYILRVDTELRYQFVNRAYAQRFGLEPQELVGRRMPEVIGEQAYQAAKPYLDRMLAGEVMHYEAVIPYDKLGRRFMRSANVLDWDDSGKLRSVIGVLIDLTERKQAEEALQEADRRKDAFLAILAHELRNPLAPIRNAVEIIKAKNPADPELSWSRDIIERQVAQMSRLLDDLLDVSRITRNRMELRKRPVSLASVVESAVETSAPLIEAAGHAFVQELPTEPVYLHADPVRLAQLLANLLNNAAKYTPDAGRIVLKAERQAHELVVSVKDNGIGIAPEMQPRLFEMFSQAKPALERAQGGLGIGLSLVKGLAELHGGHVEARSEGAGKGSEFIVRLPVIEQADASDAGPAGERPARAVKRRLLIVDDVKDTADSLSLLFRETGHEVHTAYDGEQAIVAAERYRPDAIMLDLGMPKLGGLEACRRIRAHSWGKRVFLVALTGWGQEEDRRRSREAGFDAHLVKPVDLTALRKLIDELPLKSGTESTDR